MSILVNFWNFGLQNETHISQIALNWQLKDIVFWILKTNVLMRDRIRNSLIIYSCNLQTYFIQSLNWNSLINKSQLRPYDNFSFLSNNKWLTVKDIVYRKRVTLLHHCDCILLGVIFINRNDLFWSIRSEWNSVWSIYLDFLTISPNIKWRYVLSIFIIKSKLVSRRNDFIFDNNRTFSDDSSAWKTFSL